MTDERFNELLNGPISHPIMPLYMLRLAQALRSVVEKCGEAGDAALEAHCKEQDEMDRIKSGEAFTDERRGERCKKSRGGAGVNQHDRCTKGE